jgi:hypothetical protein
MNVSKRSILDFILFYGFVITVIVIYFRVDHQWGIYLTFGGIIVLIISSFPFLYKWAVRLRYQKLISFLNSQEIIREDAIIKSIKEEPIKVHKYLFDLGSFWKNGPLVVLVKRYYIYVSKEIVLDIVRILERVQNEKNDKIVDVIKIILQKYPFETRAEVENLISKIREYNLIKNPDEKKVENKTQYSLV